MALFCNIKIDDSEHWSVLPQTSEPVRILSIPPEQKHSCRLIEVMTVMLIFSIWFRTVCQSHLYSSKNVSHCLLNSLGFFEKAVCSLRGVSIPSVIQQHIFSLCLLLYWSETISCRCMSVALRFLSYNQWMFYVYMFTVSMVSSPTAVRSISLLMAVTQECQIWSNICRIIIKALTASAAFSIMLPISVKYCELSLQWAVTLLAWFHILFRV